MTPVNMSRTTNSDSPDAAITIWLWILFGAVFAMVSLGGITRLTGSGLSMVDWRPLMGVLPPLDESEWREVFAAYQGSPQYREVNDWMTLGDFKSIFFWEYLHRVFGRMIGLIAFLPWVYFSLRGRLAKWISERVVVAILLGGLQGVLGWYMVMSGLVDRPEVSHFRLAAHLLLAVFIAQWILWTLLDLHYGRPTRAPAPSSVLPARRLTYGLALIVSIQILYGALMAGTKAGLLFPSFPDMNGVYLPGLFFPGRDLIHNALNNPHSIHYIHRLLGFGLVALVVPTLILLARTSIRPRWVVHQMTVIISIQFVLGALTALYQSPIPLAVSHQAGAFLLACSTTLLLHRCP
jgi:cytochrome c oxidase assembly protein subunit 15